MQGTPVLCLADWNQTLQISNQIRFVLLNLFQYMFLYILWQIVRIDKFSLPGQVLPQELPMKKGFNQYF